MKKILLLLLLTPFFSISQEIKGLTSPEFLGGKDSLFVYLQSEFIYSEEDKEKKIKGTVEVEFRIDKKGRVKDVKIKKSVSPLIDKEAIRVISEMPKWQPAMVNGEGTEVVTSLPILALPPIIGKEMKIVFPPVIPSVYEVDLCDGVDTRSNDVSTIHDVVAISPQFPGGQDSMRVFISENFIYPEEAKKNNEQGTVWIEFVIMADSSITSIKVVKRVSPSLDTEAIRIISIMPKWKPGEQAGKKVNVRYTIPIKAKLETIQN